ncbi:MAG: hypothetical protein M3Q64_01935 [bacterium]|nr:hypothetical protein [bacterium]
MSEQNRNVQEFNTTPDENSRDHLVENIVDKNMHHFAEWKTQNPSVAFDDIPLDQLPILIPEAAYNAVENPEEVTIRKVPLGGGIHFAAIYKSENVSEEQKLADISYSRHFEHGIFKEGEHILLMSHLFTWDKDSEVLYINNYDGLAKAGIGKAFYTETLPKVAKQFEIRFIVGNNNDSNIEFFTDENKLGRSSLKDIKHEYREKFFPNIDANESDEKVLKNATIQFLYEEDKKIYLQ